nr:polysaccharide biosynthesis C-terminal domain-containing protein [Lachnospiraceae bacterium]
TMVGTYWLSAAVAVFLTVVSIATLPFFMQAIHVSENVYAQAREYILIVLAGIVVTMLYNMFSSIMRALGNSLMPFLFLVVGTVLNVVLDYVFIGSLGLGVKGAAWATVVAQFISVLLCLGYILLFDRSLLVFGTKKEHRPQAGLIKNLFLSGLALAMMYAVVNVGTVILQGGINGLGDMTVAAHVTARKISELCMTIFSCICSTVTTFTSQNYGAGKMDRVRAGLTIALGLCAVVATIEIVFIYVLGEPMIRLVSGTENADIIAMAKRYLRTDILFYYVLLVLLVLRNFLQGVGMKLITIVASIMEMIMKALTVRFFVAPFGYTAIIFCEPFTWIACAVIVVIGYLVWNKKATV